MIGYCRDNARNETVKHAWSYRGGADTQTKVCEIYPLHFCPILKHRRQFYGETCS